MVGAVQELLKHLIVSYKPDDCDEGTLIVDSMLIMTCCGRNRHGKVAREIADEGYPLRLSVTYNYNFSTLNRYNLCFTPSGSALQHS